MYFAKESLTLIQSLFVSGERVSYLILEVNSFNSLPSSICKSLEIIVISYSLMILQGVSNNKYI